MRHSNCLCVCACAIFCDRKRCRQRVQLATLASRVAAGGGLHFPARGSISKVSIAIAQESFISRDRKEIIAEETNLSAVDELDGSLPEEEVDVLAVVHRPHEMRSCKEQRTDVALLPNWRKISAVLASDKEARRSVGRSHGREMKNDYQTGHSLRARARWHA